MKYVFGYTNFIDGSARGVVPPTNVFYQMKSRDTFAPIGPYIVTADEIKNVGKMQIRLKNNGKVMQNFNTDDMAHKIPRCIEWVTSIHTLLPGDILATGTNHRGLNPFMDGDKIELECEGCGVLHIKVQDKLKRKWARITRLQHKESGAQGVHTPQTGGKYAPAPKHREDIMLTLYYSPGACSMAAHIILEESGEKYQPQKIDTSKGEQRTPEYLKINPMGRVPALKLDDGSPLTENTAILPYLGKRFNVWPTDPVAEAKAHSLIGFLAASAHPAHAHFNRPERYATDQAAFPTIKEQGLKSFHGYLKDLDGKLAGNEWFSDKYSALDPYGLVFYVWGVRRGLPMPELKNFTAFKDRMAKRPAVGRCGRTRRFRFRFSLTALLRHPEVRGSEPRRMTAPMRYSRAVDASRLALMALRPRTRAQVTALQ